MIARILAGVSALAVSFSLVWTLASADHNTVRTTRADVDGSGNVNVIDLQLVASHWNETTLPNPCIVPEIFDDAHQPAELLQNTLGEIITPRGITYRIPGDDPRAAAVLSGTPIAAIPC